VYVAVGDNFPDALGGGPAGGVNDAPILLVLKDSIPGPTATELNRLSPSEIVILGGTGVVSDTVKANLGAYAATVRRLAGANRYATAAAVSADTFPGGAARVYVVVGENFPDALGGGPAGGYKDAPILLVLRDSIPSVTAAELVRLAPSEIVILGGTAAVSDAVAAGLGGYAGTVRRLSGANRYATAVAVSADTFPGGASLVYVAVGDNFPDALGGGPAGGVNGAPILLVLRDSIPSATAAELARLGPTEIVILGGSGVVSDSVGNDLWAYTTEP
jgi:putative cell wall-binding protein